MMRVTVFGPNLRDQSKGELVVHAADCHDCAKLRDEHPWTFDADSRRDIVEAIYPPEDFGYDADTEWAGYYAGSIYFYPCVKLPDESAEPSRYERVCEVIDAVKLDERAKDTDEYAAEIMEIFS